MSKSRRWSIVRTPARQGNICRQMAEPAHSASHYRTPVPFLRIADDTFARRFDARFQEGAYRSVRRSAWVLPACGEMRVIRTPTSGQ